MTNHTPSPQSVVVPVDDDTRPFSDSLLPEAMIYAGSDVLDKAQMDMANYVSGETIDWDQGMMAVAVYRAMLAAAPAPSSLAGGEVWAALEPFAKVADTALCPSDEPDDNDFIRLDETIAITVADIRRAASVFAALSPEAPARGVLARTIQRAIGEAWVCEHQAEVAADAVLALSREKAPASALDNLVDRFAAALKEKLHASEAKYGHNDAWMRDDWLDDLIEQLGEHVQKGDPRDVAAYCAFAWHHGWSLTPRHEAPAETTDCTTCAGNGEVVTDWEEYLSPPKDAPADHATADCPDCGGIGKVEAPASEGDA